MKKIYELKNKRATLLEDAENALGEKNMDLYNSKMTEVKSLNAQIQALEDLESENSRFTDSGITNIVGVTGGTIDRKDDDYKNAFFYAITNGVTPKNGVGNEKVSVLYDALSENGGNPKGADGGFLVPTSFNDKIIEQRRQLVKLADYFNVETVTTPTGWRAIDTAPTAGFEQVDELGTIKNDGDQPKFTKISYSLSKYGLRVPVSSELLTDNTAGLEAYLARWFAKKGVITENNKLLELLNSLTPKNLTVGKEIGSLKSAINKDLDPDISANAVIITNQSGFDFLDNMEDKQGRPLLQPDPTTGTPTIFKSHKVVMLSDAQLPNRKVTASGATKGTYYPIYIGFYKEFGTLFKKKGLEVSSTNIGGDAWATDSTEMKGITRLDAQKTDSKAAVKREIFISAS